MRHVAGGEAGGAYEWTNARGAVPRGATALQLDRQGQIVEMTSVWNGALVSAAWLAQRQAETIES